MNTKENDYELIKFADGDFSLDVKVSFENNTVWLTQKDLASLFERNRTVINKHIKSIFNDLELKRGSVCAKFAHTATDGKTYYVDHYNLDVVCTISYHIKSYRANKFIEWTKDILNNHNVQNYSQISQLIRFSHNNIVLDVNVSPKEDTVWLNKDQLSLLYETTRQNIEYHIANIYEQNELEIEATCKEILQVQIEGNRSVNRITNLYNLDMIISLGYRINSRNGIIFRRWATKVLKEFLLTGSVVNAERCLACTSNILELNNKVSEIEKNYYELKDIVYSSNKMFYEGELVEPFFVLRKLFFLAKNTIIIIDNYADNTVLELLKGIKTKTYIITRENTYLNKESLPSNIHLIKGNKEHDRIIIIDDYVYFIGTSFNDIGKHRFALFKIDNMPKEFILKGIKLE